MNTKLITALRTTAKAIETGTFAYKWTYLRSCNCGALFCALTGASAAELNNRIKPAVDCLKAAGGIDAGYSPTWVQLVGHYCPITGIPTHELFKELYSYGLSARDILDLEYLRNEDVLKRLLWFESRPVTFLGLKTGRTKRVPIKPDRLNGFHAAAYMRAWADLLQEKGAQDVGQQPATQEYENQQA